VGSYQARGVY